MGIWQQKLSTICSSVWMVKLIHFF